MNRRRFIGISSLAAPLLAIANKTIASPTSAVPIVISTWEPNIKANGVAWEILSKNGSALDAVHKGVMVPEADPNDQTVGYGGRPDRDGHVTLDACIMDELGNCGAVMALEFIKHPISVARLVMEKTPYVQIAGDGALQFALANGFVKENLLTDKSKREWKDWLKISKYKPTSPNTFLKTNKTNHDTIGMLALDVNGNISGACSTSGLAYKMHGRVGDSPIIGAGLFVDNEIGAAVATGQGEEVVRIAGSHTVVEMMRQGKNPTEACREAIGRIVRLKDNNKLKEIQVGFIALNKKGEYGCFSLNKDFTIALHTSEGGKIIHSESWLP